ncbi:MAG TPA: hypothetical protein VHU80_08095, partial [Polyangiaceae bacterium]|nr:hypothetical protein [Polyangiaceae bacterium]
MRSSSVAWLGLLSVTACHASLGPVESASSVLPLHAVRLYENGVGYFEREGVLTAGAGSTLGVPASHVDDALKTLIVLSRGRAQVSGIEFPSIVSDGAARSLAGLPLEGESPADYEHVLRSLVGFRVEIAADSRDAVRGRLLDVERDAVPAPAIPASASPMAPKDAGPAVFSLLIVADSGELSRVSTSVVRTIRPLDRAFSARLQTAADALSGRSAQLKRELRVRASATAPVRIGYIAETPIWRASYRLVLPGAGEQAALQGWALVHNDTDEAWSDVEVELVNGSPDSFLFPMAAPRYTRRPLDTPDTELSTVPQLALRTPDGLWGDHVETDGAGGLGLSGVGEGGGGYGEGIGLGGIGTIGHGSGSGGTSSSDAVAIGDLSQLATAKGKDEGRLFSYHLAEKVSLGAHGSSLLPMLAHPVSAKRFTRFTGEGTGRAAVRFTNESPYILPAGPVAVFEPAGFSGETLIDRLRPQDRAFLEYGVDLDATLAVEKKELSSKVVHVSFERDGLRRDEVLVSERRLGVENHAATARPVGYVLSGVVTNAKVEGADELDYDAKFGAAIAFMTAPAQSELERTLRITEARASDTPLERLTRASVEPLAAAESLPATERAALRAALPGIAA